jgi:hypothetical protein
MVTDYTYAEFGFDKDGILAAMSKFNIYQDHSFDILLKRIHDFKKSND